jgi:hypothetical protein
LKPARRIPRFAFVLVSTFVVCTIYYSLTLHYNFIFSEMFVLEATQQSALAVQIVPLQETQTSKDDIV